MPLNSENIKGFWDKRAEKYENKKSFSITNLEEDERIQKLKIILERKKIFKLLKLNSHLKVIDLGSGIGAWSILFAKKCNQVVAVEYSQKMIDIAKQLAKKKSINNIEFICENVLDFKTRQKFDVIFISGLLIYILDEEIGKLLKNIYEYSKTGTILLLRDSTGISGRHEIIQEYSEALKTNYSALYRTRSEYIEFFERIGYSLIFDEDMFDEGSPLNKWKETRLRIYLFKQIKK